MPRLWLLISGSLTRARSAPSTASLKHGLIDQVRRIANRTSTLIGTRAGRRRGSQSRRRGASAEESTEIAESPATPGAEAEREGEADKKEVRAGPRGTGRERD